MAEDGWFRGGVISSPHGPIVMDEILRVAA
jgi:hypothetical protein